MTKQQSQWNADAEMSMQGYTIPVQSKEHLTHLVKYTLNTLKGLYDPDMDVEQRATEIVDNACNNYNSDKEEVRYFTVNNSNFGTLMTFVRDKDKLTSSKGVLAWVENLDAPYCSELGYVYFQEVRGKVRRVS